jgi:hypothetical protein
LFLSNVEYNKEDTGFLSRGFDRQEGSAIVQFHGAAGQRKNALKLAAPKGNPRGRVPIPARSDDARRVVERNLCEAGHLGIWQEPNAAIEW